MTTWHPTTPPWYTETAERVCTPKQLEVLRLASHELTDTQIADRINISRQAVQQRRTGGQRTLTKHFGAQVAA